MNSKFKACEVLLTVCSNCKKGEKILFVTDPDSYEVASKMWEAAKEFPNKSLIMMDKRTMHGQDPNDMVAVAMMEADVIFGITSFSLFHSNARKNAVRKGSRFVNMVDYSMEMLEKGGLYVDFIEQGKICSKMAELIIGDEIRITSEKGTNIVAKITGRPPVPQYGRSLEKGSASSPPDIECAIGAIEGTANGVVYIDGSIPHPELGLIVDDIKLTIAESKIVDISGGEQAKILARILKDFNDPNVYYVGEIGLGLNPMCELTGRMLEDEGTMGTLHFGIGNSTSFHGTIESPYHLDLVFRKPTVTVDGNLLLDNGELGFKL